MTARPCLPGDTTSLWMRALPPSGGGELGPLAEGGEVEVCVVGAGIAGLSTAYELVRSGRRVLVLDAMRPGHGETGRTTAHLASALDDRFTHLEAVHGVEGARLAAESHAAAIDFIERVAREEGIDCGFSRQDGYLCLGADADPKMLDAELEAARRAGLTVERLPRAPAGRFEGPCLRFANQAQFRPLEYLAGLSKAILRAGGRIVSATRVVAVRGSDPVEVITDNGVKVRARAVVVATNTPINDTFVIHTKQAPYRSYALALGAPAGLAPVGLIWDTDDPYHYVRWSTTSADGAVLVVGGEDHKTGQDDAEHEGHRALEHWDRLEEWIRGHFPEAGEVVARWSGQVMEPSDGLAFIGKNPADPGNVFVVTGDSGHGLTHGTIAAMMLPTVMVGAAHPWSKLYEPSRKSLRALPRFVRENLNVAAQYLDWALPGDVASEDAIPPGEGAVVRHGLRKIAVFKDARGVCHRSSAACPHLGGVVAWNAAEKTWDCPLHGSRFDARGKVVSGPATRDLAEEHDDDTREAPPVVTPLTAG